MAAMVLALEVNGVEEDLRSSSLRLQLSRWVVLAGIVHLLMDSTVLSLYCWDYGCMEPGCEGWGLQRCLPTYSRLFLVQEKDAEVGTARAALATLGVLIFRACVEVLILRRAYMSLCHESRSVRRSLYSCVATLVALFSALIVVFPGNGTTENVHIICADLAVCFFLLGVFLFACEMPEKARRVAWAIVLLVVADGLCGLYLLANTWTLGPATWTKWVVVEWAGVFIQGFIVIAMGIGLRLAA